MQDNLMGALQDIISTAATHNLTLLPRYGNEAAWQEVWDSLTYHSIDQAPDMLEYQVAYFRDVGWKLEDASVIFFQEGRPCGIWPLHVGERAGTTTVSMAGTPLRLPMFGPHLAKTVMRRMFKSALHTLCNWAGGLPIENVSIRNHVPCSNTLARIDFVDRQLLSMGATTRLHHELHVDLRATMDQIRLGFRKSFRPLINANLHTWSTFIMDKRSADRATWQEFRELHFDSAGQRWTRNESTWDIQYEILQSGTGFLVGLRDLESGRLTGAGFFQNTRDEGVYAVAAYDRALFDKPLGHIVQFIAIKHMKALGLSNYRLGDRHYPGDYLKPTAKEVDISYFKEGFASGIYRAVTYILPTHR